MGAGTQLSRAAKVRKLILERLFFLAVVPGAAAHHAQERRAAPRPGRHETLIALKRR
jgi:hypothetical protein